MKQSDDYRRGYSHGYEAGKRRAAGDIKRAADTLAAMAEALVDQRTAASEPSADAAAQEAAAISRAATPPSPPTAG